MPLPNDAWIPCADDMPDSDATVMIHQPGDADPVWIGLHDGDTWRTADGERTEVTHWCHFPPPPSF